MRLKTKLRTKLYKNVFVILIVFYSIVEVVSFLKDVFSHILGKSLPGQLDPVKYYGIYLVDWIIVLLVMFFITLTIRTDVFKRERFIWVRLFSFHLIISVLFSFGIFALSYFIFKIYGILPERETFANLVITNGIVNFNLNFLTYFSMISIVYLYFYYEDYKKREIDKLLLEAKLIKEKNNTLKSQLQPHFLYNALNSISTLINIDSVKAKKAILILSELMREITIGKNQERIKLSDELRILDKYIHLIKVRYHPDVIVEQFIDPDIQDVLVPNFILQPIVENSIKHGFSREINKLNIKIKITRNVDSLLISVTNNGKKLTKTMNDCISNGGGLKNMIERLNSLYNENYSFNMVNLIEESGVKTSIKIPVNFD